VLDLKVIGISKLEKEKELIEILKGKKKVLILEALN
jgi:hypothetical protein